MVEAEDRAGNKSSKEGELFEIVHDIKPAIDMLIAGAPQSGDAPLIITKDTLLTLASIDDLVIEGDEDGLGVVGESFDREGREACLWTAENGMIGLGSLPDGDPDSIAYGISADGSVVVGRADSKESAPNWEPFRWTAEEEMVGLGDLPGGLFIGVAHGASATGGVVVVFCGMAHGSEALRGTDAVGRGGLGEGAEVGLALGGEALRILERTAVRRGVEIAAAAKTIEMPRQRVAWTVEAARRQHEVLLEELGVYRGETWAAGTNTATAGMLNPVVYGNGRTQMLLAENQDRPPIRADLQAFLIGDLRISASPGELFNELGAQIKDGGGRDSTWVASYSSDYIGYISTRLPHEETAVIPLEEIVDQTRHRRYYGTTTSPFAPEAGELLVRESIALLGELK